MYLQLASEANLSGYWRNSLIVHIVCWLAQFIGHGAFEKRNPALMDNILLTAVAPDFVFIEVGIIFLLNFFTAFVYAWMEERCLREM